MRHILTFDFEDWHQLCYRYLTGRLISSSRHLEAQTDRILECLEEVNTKATFFVLGLVAKSEARKIRELAELGHEIASHGYNHQRVFTQSRTEFREDVRRSIDILEQITGSKVLGYRAPEFSIIRENLWALDELCELGLDYDSSLFPIRHRRYGMVRCPRSPFLYCGSNGTRIIELPLSTVRLFGANLPVAGGGYFRLLPERILMMAAKKVESEELPLITYFHPYEMSEKPLSIKTKAAFGGFRVRARALWFDYWFNLGREGVLRKLSNLLRRHNFGTCKEFIADGNFRKSPKLLQLDCRTF